MSAKIEGQERSLFDLLESTWDQFVLVLNTIPKGHLFTVNSVRDLLDIADIPVRSRGGLFARAARAGLMEPALHMGYQLFEPSLGSSANGAGVKVYRRTT